MLQALLLAAALANVATPATPPVIPPTPSFRRYGVAEGLPSASAYGLVQDQRGYLWVGTRDGLARYDARNFTVFRHDPANPASLLSNDVSALLVAHDGRLWLGGEGNGLERLRADGRGFDHWLHDPRDPASLAGNDVMSLVEGPDDAIWVGVYGGGLNRLRPGGSAFAHWRHRAKDASSLVSDNVTALAFDTRGSLWIGTDAGLQRMGHNGKIASVPLPTATPASVWQLQVTADGIDVATSAGLFRITLSDHGAVASVHLIGAAEQTLASLRGNDGTWIGRQDALEFVDDHGAVRRYTRQSGRLGSLPGNVPVDIFRDREGGLWTALLDGGLAYLAPGRRAFSDWQHVSGDATSLATERVRALARAGDGGVWVGGPDGALDRLDPVTGTVQHFAASVGLAASSIAALAVDAKGRVWIGHQHGLRLLDGSHARDVDLGDAMKRHGVWALLAARDDRVLVAVNGGGVLRVDPQTLASTAIAFSGAGDSPQVDHLQQAADGAIWASGPSGLLRLAPGAHAFAPVAGIADGRVDAFAFAADGSLWAAREDALQHYRLDGTGAQRIDSVDAAHGWPVVEAGGMAIDGAGNVLVTTPRGLVRYAPAMHALYVFSNRDGMASAAFTAGTLLPSADGRMLFAGSLDGIVGIRPQQLQAPSQPPLPVLGSLSVRRAGRVLDLDPTKPVALRWNDRELTVGADALSFVDPTHNRYRFRLRPFDSGWIETGTRNVREFSELHAGSYTLAISVATAGGTWSAATTPLRINVESPPWATPYAYSLYVVAASMLVLLTGWLTRRHLRQVHRYDLVRERQLFAEESNAAKSHFLANMAHEIRTPLTGVLGMTELLLKTPLNERQSHYADAIRRSGALLLRHVNDALDVARIEAGKLELNAAPFNPAALLHDVAAADAGLAAQKQIGIDVVVASDAPRAVLGDALRVQQVLLNLTHNAIKFSVDGNVTLRLARDGACIRYDVSDRGPGMTPAECAQVFARFEQAEHGRQQRGSGLGLAISQELVTLMGGAIDVHSVPGRGSTFSVRLPLTEVAAAESPTAPAAVAPSPAVIATPASRLRVMLVEDDAIAGQAIAGLIETCGYDVMLAPQALAALAEIDSGTAFAAMVFDFDLPGMGGCELATLLRARGDTTPILALTASARGDEEQRAFAAGMNAFLRKPVLPEPLREALDAAMTPAA